jgi:hypothetical protein
MKGPKELDDLLHDSTGWTHHYSFFLRPLSKTSIQETPKQLINVIRNYNDAPDDSNATYTCTSDVYKWKLWIFAAKSPIKLAN